MLLSVCLGCKWRILVVSEGVSEHVIFVVFDVVMECFRPDLMYF